MNLLKKLVLKMCLSKKELQLLENGYTDENRDNIKGWLIDILPKIVKDYRNNCKYYPRSLNPDKNQYFEESSKTKWLDLLDKISNYLNESNPNRCHWRNRYRSNTKKYYDEEIKIKSYRTKCLHKGLRILDFYIEEMHQ